MFDKIRCRLLQNHCCCNIITGHVPLLSTTAQTEWLATHFPLTLLPRERVKRSTGGVNITWRRNKEWLIFLIELSLIGAANCCSNSITQLGYHSRSSSSSTHQFSIVCSGTPTAMQLVHIWTGKPFELLSIHRSRCSDCPSSIARQLNCNSIDRKRENCDGSEGCFKEMFILLVFQ